MFPSAPRLVAAIIGLGIGLLVGDAPSRAATWRLTGRGGDAESGETPVLVDLRVPLPPGNYLLDPDGQARPIAAVVFPDRDRRFLGTVLPRVPARREFSFVLKPLLASEPQTADGIRFQPQGRNLLITLDGQE